MGLPLQKMTLAEFLQWEDAQAERHEFYRGDILAMVGGSAFARVFKGVAREA